MRRGLVGVAIAVLLASCDGDASECDADAIRAALASASSGDVVRVGACRVRGPFVVGQGVTLEGVGAESVIEVAEGELGVELTGGALARLTIESRGRAGVAIGGAGEVDDVEVRAARGIALAVRPGASGALHAVRLVGEVTAENADDTRWVLVAPGPQTATGCAAATCACEPGAIDGERTCDALGRWATMTATHGLVVEGTVVADDVEVLGLARVGVLVRDASATFDALHVADTIGAAVVASESELVCRDCTIERTREGLRGQPSYALITGGGTLTTEALRLTDNDRYGAVAAGGAIDHAGLVAEQQGDVVVWAAGVESLALRALERDETIRTSIADGEFAGVVISDSAHVSISDVTIASVGSSRRPVGLIGAIEIGDGLHVIRSLEDVVMARVEVSGAARAGIVLDVGGAATLPRFEQVSVDARGSALGAVAGAPVAGTDTLQVATPPGGWDSGIERLGDAVTNDAAFTGALDAVLSAMPPSATEVLGVVAPMY
ncbi:hypothetical protein [Sandaracinus amylolyticus]|uniref:Lipoprotein n=1 Tax=Sandaracinus amylolyticus TaxID=927083 RepID=A0A0F6YL33_9BACT|nr:hypothetical protein [Sandaracinus amylolyticus]AKF09891.1 hypothetical protein DB32_007040 [Sandaracinus amylolyticus]